MSPIEKYSIIVTTIIKIIKNYHYQHHHHQIFLTIITIKTTTTTTPFLTIITTTTFHDHHHHLTAVPPTRSRLYRINNWAIDLAASIISEVTATQRVSRYSLRPLPLLSSSAQNISLWWYFYSWSLVFHQRRGHSTRVILTSRSLSFFVFSSHG